MRIATLCGMGFGTSMMLKLWVDEILKAEGIKAEVIPTDLGSFKGLNADIIVAPTDMERHVQGASGRLALIRNLVDKAEVRQKVLSAIQEFQEGARS
jgi:PTS system ascorbate-specific IIB component